MAITVKSNKNGVSPLGTADENELDKERNYAVCSFIVFYLLCVSAFPSLSPLFFSLLYLPLL